MTRMLTDVRCSVVICTFNGATRLRPTLESIARCGADFSVEIIIVDNNSNDSSAAVAQRIWDETDNREFGFRVVNEATPGLAFARRAGVREARGDIIVFCDDDNWLDPSYLIIAVEVMGNSGIGAVGGQGEPRMDGPLPTFMYGAGHDYAIGVQSLRSGDVTSSRGYLWGAGLVVRRRDMIQLYECPGFPLLSGRKGAQLAAGEDSEICAGLRLLGRRLYYDDRLRFAHWIDAERVTIEYFANLRDGIRASGPLLQYYEALRELRARSSTLTAVISGLRWLRWIGNEREKWRHRFAFLAAIRLPIAMTSTERAFYEVHRHFSASRQRLG